MKTKDCAKTTVSERIRLIIVEKFEKSITDFAKATGINRTTVSNILNPKPNKEGEIKEVAPTLETMQRIIECREINIDADWLMTGEGHPYKGEEEKSEIMELKEQIKEMKGEISRYTKKGMDEMMENERLRIENTELKRLLETIKIDPKMRSA